MISLNEQQRAAVETESRRALVLAGAGSGKTRVLVERIAHLIEHKKVSPFEIVAMTFTRKAGGEMKSRLEARLGKSSWGIQVGTMHAFALKMLHRFGDTLGLKPNTTVYSEWEESYIIRDVAATLGVLKGKTWKVPKRDIDDVFQGYYRTGAEPSPDCPGYKVFKGVVARFRENNGLSYGSLLIGLRALLPTLKKYLTVKHLFVDEIQDNDELQWTIVNEICQLFGAALFVVGDLDQCQPAGTKVLLDDMKEIDIADLDPSIHKLRVYSKQDSIIYGGHNKGYSFKKNERKFSGRLIKISADGKKTRCTPNHKWWVRWSDRSPEKNIVYMMRKGKKFRVGWCQLFMKGSGHVHLGSRARLENADAAWILKIFDNKKDASIYEQIVNVKYGLPTILFEPSNGCLYYDKEGISKVFESVGSSLLQGRAEICLLEHGRSLAHPFWVKEDYHAKQGNKHVFEVVACNLIDGLFKIPLRRKNRLIEWKIASIKKEIVSDLTVYSLDVEKYHTYVADGICTRNSIFEWRGACPKYLLEHQTEFDIYHLQVNYRSGVDIVSAANRLIRYNTERIDHSMTATREGGYINAVGGMDSDKISYILSNVKDTRPDVILSRTHVLLQSLAAKLDDLNIPYNYVGQKSKLTNTEAFRRFHAFLKLIVNPMDNFSFLLIKDIVGLSAGGYSSIRLDAIIKMCSHYHMWAANYTGPWQDLFGNDLEMNDALAIIEANLQHESSSYDFSMAAAFAREHMATNIQDYLDWLATYDIQEEVTDNDDRLQLMTIHAAKGLEWPSVMIIGCNEGSIPSKQAEKNGDIEAERRLMYVAMTRVEEKLILAVRPEVKEYNGKIYESPVSRFIGEALH